MSSVFHVIVSSSVSIVPKPNIRLYQTRQTITVIPPPLICSFFFFIHQGFSSTALLKSSTQPWPFSRSFWFCYWLQVVELVRESEIPMDYQPRISIAQMPTFTTQYQSPPCMYGGVMLRWPQDSLVLWHQTTLLAVWKLLKDESVVIWAGTHTREVSFETWCKRLSMGFCLCVDSKRGKNPPLSNQSVVKSNKIICQ